MYLDPGRGQDLAARLALQAPGPDHLNLQISALVHQAQLDVAQHRGAEYLHGRQISENANSLHFPTCLPTSWPGPSPDMNSDNCSFLVCEVSQDSEPVSAG